MKILRLQIFVPPFPGGMENHVRFLTDEQRKMGHDVFLLFNTGSSEHPRDVAVLSRFGLIHVTPEVLRSTVFAVAACWRLARERESFDVMHVHGGWSLVLLGSFLARFFGVRAVVASAHGSLRAGRLKSRLVRLAFGRADVIYATGRTDAARLAHLLARPVEWQASGIPANFFAESAPRDLGDGVKIVIVVANLKKIKNIDLVVEIARLMPECQFEVVGDGPECKHLHTKIAALDCCNVLLLGHLPRSQVRDKLDLASIFLCTSYSEGTPTSMIEGMARGLPVVSSNCADLSALLGHGAAGTVIDGFEARDYATRIREVLHDRALYRRQSVSAVAAASQFNWPCIVKRITGWMQVAANANAKI